MAKPAGQIAALIEAAFPAGRMNRATDATHLVATYAEGLASAAVAGGARKRIQTGGDAVPIVARGQADPARGVIVAGDAGGPQTAICVAFLASFGLMTGDAQAGLRAGLQGVSRHEAGPMQA